MVAGIARLALLGWLLARVAGRRFAGGADAGASSLTAAVTASAAARSTTRARWWPIAPRPRVQAAPAADPLRRTWRCSAPPTSSATAPATSCSRWSRACSSSRSTSVSICRSSSSPALTPLLIFAFVAFLDLPRRAGDAGRRARRRCWPRPSGTAGTARPAWPARGLRAPSAPSSSTPCRGWPRSRPSARAVPGLARLAARAHAPLREHDVGARHQHAGARHHRRRASRWARRRRWRWGAWRVRRRQHGAASAADHPACWASRCSGRCASCARCSTRGCWVARPPRGHLRAPRRAAGGVGPAGRRRDAARLPAVAFEDVTLSLSGRAPARASTGSRFEVRAGRARGHRGPERRGQVDRGAPPAALLRPAGRRGHARRARPARADASTRCAARSRW